MSFGARVDDMSGYIFEGLKKILVFVVLMCFFNVAMNCQCTFFSTDYCDFFLLILVREAATEILADDASTLLLTTSRARAGLSVISVIDERCSRFFIRYTRRWSTRQSFRWGEGCVKVGYHTLDWLIRLMIRKTTIFDLLNSIQQLVVKYGVVTVLFGYRRLNISQFWNSNSKQTDSVFVQFCVMTVSNVNDSHSRSKARVHLGV